MALAIGCVARIGAAAQNSTGEDFYIISSVDLPKSQILLKRPTEVTVLIQVNKQTRIADQSGKSIPLSGLRAGSTVWIHSAPAEGSAVPLAVSIREGPMTVGELHRLYLDYPVIQ